MSNYRCNTCKVVKPASEFHKNATNTQRGLVYKCKSCQRARHILKTYGLSWDDYQKMYQALEGKCPLCSRWYEHLAVDHNHETGEVRGLLCISCNRALGYFENIEWSARALEYLNVK